MEEGIPLDDWTPESTRPQSDSMNVMSEIEHPVQLTPKQQKAEEQYQKFKQMAVGKDYSSIESLNILSIQGVDKEGRQIVVLRANILPAKTVDLKLLLLYFISVMDPIVEEDYTLVFIGSNLSSENRPPTDWLSTAYTMFNRKYKKNLKALFIIHATTVVRLVLRLVKPFISVKFWKKLTYIDDINDIYEYIDREQITFPNSVIRFNAKKFRPPPMFGSLLSTILESENNVNGIPHMVESSFAYLRNYLHVEGLFRVSGENALIKELVLSYNLRERVDLSTIEDPHVVSCLLKRFLGSLAEPLFPHEYYDIILSFYRLLASEYPDLWIAKTAGVVKDFPPEHFRLLRALFAFLTEVTAHSDENLMVPSTIATVIGPNVLKTKLPPTDLNELHEANQVIELFIIHHEDIFSTAEQQKAIL
eukprot:CAMPEP_0206187968 /NCGR_PEP_ID=MMETSP0166-20121206/3316_1 /ASSEMBLY_ACC=CAM_ASM_000260 /TAXON_ID=95228 /ORGANISM="Vannella robusta, Strain DIVA3 518/3/11/1/6" /LENGTH=418 /DNA_ID=CAMNT_0053603649 /DNA_START=249 /DNA_END=1501 /DNA_ORIENTATION=+